MSVTLLRVASSPNLEVLNSNGLLDSFGVMKLGDSSRFLSRDFVSIRAKKNDMKKSQRVCSLSTDVKYACVGQSGLESTGNFPLLPNVLSSTAVGEVAISSEQKVYDVVLKQASLVKRKLSSTGELEVKPEIVLPGNLSLLSEAYDRCGEICAEYAKTFYLGTLLMTPERRRAIWAIYVWCRRTDELVDGPNASHITAAAMDRWESRLDELFRGRPFDMLDAALSDTVAKFPVDIQPFKDMIEGMRMDLKKSRYTTFDELYLYCYYVAGTVGLMSVPVMGISTLSQVPTESVYNGALALGIANQLTNILRDVGEE
ncbi:hypothetical protein TSUD_213960 [Trifolium subterraneum]|uniref:15-cis-phytoene synthase n=1 Tax=Trifolium subterraneum TaxID=3900 RepID=A0A2Z6MKB5_TRISU|nr:hypothetical protein TSUD_213960 [Trifolium subterraneum]